MSESTYPELEVSTFKVGGARFGINILSIQEINKDLSTTKVPGAPDDIQGILNLRGHIVTSIDLGKKLGLGRVKKGRGNRNIIINSEGEHIGLLVDEITEVVRTVAEEIEPPPSNINGVNGKYFKGVLKTSGGLIGILDIEAVLSV